MPPGTKRATDYVEVTLRFNGRPGGSNSVSTGHLLLSLVEEREATLAGLQVAKDAVDAFLESAEGDESLGQP